MGTNVSPSQRCLGHGSDKHLVGKRPRAMQPSKWPQLSVGSRQGGQGVNLHTGVGLWVWFEFSAIPWWWVTSLEEHCMGRRGTWEEGLILK